MAVLCSSADVQLSVIIPTKNRLDFVQRAIIAFTSFSEIETIFVDDGSVEQCVSNVKSLFSGQSNCRYVRTHLINILGCGFCETGIAQGVSAQMNGWPLGTDRRAVGIG